MSLSRRSFLRGAAVAAAVAPVIPLVVAKGNAASLAPTAYHFAETEIRRMDYVGRPTILTINKMPRFIRSIA